MHQVRFQGRAAMPQLSMHAHSMATTTKISTLHPSIVELYCVYLMRICPKTLLTKIGSVDQCAAVLLNAERSCIHALIMMVANITLLVSMTAARRQKLHIVQDLPPSQFSFEPLHDWPAVPVVTAQHD